MEYLYDTLEPGTFFEEIAKPVSKKALKEF